MDKTKIRTDKENLSDAVDASKKILLSDPGRFSNAILERVLNTALEIRQAASGIFSRGNDTSSNKPSSDSLQSHQDRIRSRQSEVIKGVIDRHPFVERGREIVSEIIQQKNLKNILCVGCGSGREMQVIAQNNPQLRSLLGVDMQYIGREDLRQKAIERVAKAAPKRCKTDIWAQDVLHHDFLFPLNTDTIVMSLFLHDLPQRHQENLLDLIDLTEDIKHLVLLEIIMPSELGPNYNYTDGKCPEDIKNHIFQMYIRWLRALWSNRDKENIAQLIKYSIDLLTKGYPAACKGTAEQFETVYTLSDKLDYAGFGKITFHQVSKDIFIIHAEKQGSKGPQVVDLRNTILKY